MALFIKLTGSLKNIKNYNELKKRLRKLYRVDEYLETYSYHTEFIS